MTGECKDVEKSRVLASTGANTPATLFPKAIGLLLNRCAFSIGGLRRKHRLTRANFPFPTNPANLRKQDPCVVLSNPEH
jgi:hypothetical protein